MDNTNPQQPAAPVAPQPVTPPTTPVATAPPPPVSPSVTPPAEHKGKGLIFVAIVLTILIILLVALYFVIIKQSSQETAPVETTPSAQTQPTPTQVVTPTATEEQEAENLKITDPTKEVDAVSTQAESL